MQVRSENQHSMNRFLYILVTVFFGISCSKKQEDYEKTTFNQQFHSVLKSLLEARFKDVSLVQAQTKPIFRPEDVLNISAHDSRFIPPRSVIYYDKTIFKALVEQQVLGVTQARDMYNSTDTTHTENIKSSEINLPTISIRKLKEIFSDNNNEDGSGRREMPQDIVNRMYGSRSFNTWIPVLPNLFARP